MKDHIVYLRDRYPGIDIDKMSGTLYGFSKDLIDQIPSEIKNMHLKYEEESCMEVRPQVDYDRLEVGDLVWIDSMENLMSAPNWHEAEITHKYAGVIFYRFTDDPGMEEENLSSRSFGYIRGVYPKKVVVPEGITMECYCPYTEFVHSA